MSLPGPVLSARLDPGDDFGPLVENLFRRGLVEARTPPHVPQLGERSDVQAGQLGDVDREDEFLGHNYSF